MSRNESVRAARIRRNSRASKAKKKAISKAKRPPGYKRPQLLLHKITGPRGSGIRKKDCTICKEKKSLKEFGLWKKGDRGLTYTSGCISCLNSVRRLKPKKFKRKINYRDPAYREQQNRYAANNPDKFAEYRRRLLEKFPDYFKKKMREKRAKMKARTIAARERLNDKDGV